jgi:hypothetical protein
MDVPSTVRLLASTNNARGDLFTRLVSDLFFALGYDDLRFDVHKAGRELDIQGNHRFEPRSMVAECKAYTSKKMGGAELNKFLGALTRERTRSAPGEVAGYFVSLSGFTETGIEQEKSTDDNRVILLDAQKVIETLTTSNVLVGITEAVEPEGAELLGHKRGYVWAVYYAQGKERTHLALIHADGTPLAQSVAQEVIDADHECGGSLESLDYLAPPPATADREALSKKAVDRYRQWLETECGFIQLDGLPADTELSATRMKLERLFVPLKANFLSPTRKNATDMPEKQDNEAHSFGEILAGNQRLAILADPGGGKSTLLKRIAIAYAYPERLNEIEDDLPKRDWLPIFVRCRDLRNSVQDPILGLLDKLSLRAGMDEDQAVVFRRTLHETLVTGRALFIVDGLDEISVEGDRQIFAKNLRTFMAMFPLAAVLVTSREAGFRQVAGVVASACTAVKIAPLEKDDVHRLCESWYVEVVGDREEVRTEARELAKTIWESDRIRPLAENPLLLTTLLVVKRCVGELPRGRHKLYRAAVDVLIRTWNVEGHEPLDEDETLAQLSYVACTMMESGKQRIGQKALMVLLQKAHKELEAELQFAKISPRELIKRIEGRSSLIIQAGQEVIDDQLRPVYEFRHLTFQEYLAARGYVEEQYAGRDDGRKLEELLQPHFEDDFWGEVIPLATVMAGRKSEGVVKCLTEKCEKPDLQSPPGEVMNYPPVLLLRKCLVDEVQVTASSLDKALVQMARYGSEGQVPGSVFSLLRGKFGVRFREVIESTYMGGGDGWDDCIDTMSDLVVYDRFDGGKSPQVTRALLVSLRDELSSNDRAEKVKAALACMELAFALHEKHVDSELIEPFTRCRDAICTMLDPSDSPLALSASWALVWFGQSRVSPVPPESCAIVSLHRISQDASSRELARIANWALGKQPLLPRDAFDESDWGDTASDLRDRQEDIDQDGRLAVAFYRRAPWSDEELAKRIGDTGVEPGFENNPTLLEILHNLGDAGKTVLKSIDEERKKKS